MRSLENNRIFGFLSSGNSWQNTGHATRRHLPPTISLLFVCFFVFSFFWFLSSFLSFFYLFILSTHHYLAFPCIFPVFLFSSINIFYRAVSAYSVHLQHLSVCNYYIIILYWCSQPICQVNHTTRLLETIYQLNSFLVWPTNMRGIKPVLCRYLHCRTWPMGAERYPQLYTRLLTWLACHHFFYHFEASFNDWLSFKYILKTENCTQVIHLIHVLCP